LRERASLQWAGLQWDDTEVAAVRTALGEQKFAALWREGSVMTLDEALAYALRDDEPSESEP
jgi:hypothetical protein